MKNIFLWELIVLSLTWFTVMVWLVHERDQSPSVVDPEGRKYALQVSPTIAGMMEISTISPQAL